MVFLGTEPEHGAWWKHPGSHLADPCLAQAPYVLPQKRSGEWISMWEVFRNPQPSTLNPKPNPPSPCKNLNRCKCNSLPSVHLRWKLFAPPLYYRPECKIQILHAGSRICVGRSTVPRESKNLLSHIYIPKSSRPLLSGWENAVCTRTKHSHTRLRRNADGDGRPMEHASQHPTCRSA